MCASLFKKNLIKFLKNCNARIIENKPDNTHICLIRKVVPSTIANPTRISTGKNVV